MSLEVTRHPLFGKTAEDLREAVAEGRSMGYLLISCGSCHDELRRTTFYEPPHDIKHRQAGPWLVS